MTRYWIAGVLALVTLSGLVAADETPLLMRGGIEGREFSEVGRLYVDDDELIHFRTEQRLYYFSHMYYIWDTLQAAGVVTDGQIIYGQPLRITGNYSKAKYVYNFLEEPALRGSQIMWIDRVEQVELPIDEQSEFTCLFDGESLSGWSMIPATVETDAAVWKVKDKVLLGAAPSVDATHTLISETCYADFELTFEYRACWGNSASLLLRANEQGEGIALSLDHIDEGTIGFPKSATAASRPFMLYETRQEHGVGIDTHIHLQYDGRFNYDAVARDELLQCSQLSDFLNEWDGGFWNIVKIRCVGREPVITFWINGFQVSKFNAQSVAMSEKVPAHIGAIKNYTVYPSGHIGFALHCAQVEKPSLLLRELRVRKLE